MSTEFGRTMSFPGRFGFLGSVLAVVGLFVVLFAGPFRTVPAGHVGVKDFFGLVSSGVLPPGIRIVAPLTRVVKMSSRRWRSRNSRTSLPRKGCY